MDEYSKYLTWVKSKKMQGNSWESQAFGRDHQDHGLSCGSPFGGLVWPPRSYSCGFCNRQFRSAQALGGHMNVHRRDRARLKQDQHQEPAAATRDHNDNIVNCNPSSCVNLVVNHNSSDSTSSSNSSSRTEEGHCDHDPEKGNYVRRKKREKDVNLCIGLSLGGPDVINAGCKRMKVSTTHVVPTFPSFLHPSSRSSSSGHDEATIRINGPSMEDLDLELRLGSLY